MYKNAVGPLSGNTPVTEFTYDYKGQRASKTYTRENGSTLTTYYVSPTFEIRIDSEKSNATVTKHVMLEGKGRIATINDDTVDADDFAMMTYVRLNQTADMMPDNTLADRVSKMMVYGHALAIHPDTGEAVKQGLKVLLISIFIFLIILNWKREEGRYNSRFALWQRFAAVPVICIFFLTACQTDYDSMSSPDGTWTIPDRLEDLVLSVIPY